MSDWEFLLQKEGDRSWLPLESPNVEILEGRYRLVARSNLPEADVQIRILYESTEEDPPVRRVQTRSTRTNKEGLMAIIPYTNLKPGIWELACQPGKGISNSLFPTNLQGIQLQVLPCESDPIDFAFSPEGEEAVDSSSSSATDTETVGAQESNIAEDSSEGTLADRIKPLLKKNQSTALEEAEKFVSTGVEKEISGEEDVSFSETDEGAIALTQSSLVSPVLKLTLEQESYIAKLGEIIVLSGTVSSEIEAEKSAENLTPVVGAVLKICLRDPGTSKRLADIEQPLPERVPPIVFACTIAVPEKINTRLILGEIVLKDRAETIVSQSFTITTPLEDWLEAIDGNFSEEKHQALPPAIAQQQQNVLSPSLLNMLEGAATIPEQQQPTAEDSIPPLLYQPTEESETARYPELPTVGNSLSEGMGVDGVNLTQLLATAKSSVPEERPKSRELPEELSEEEAESSSAIKPVEDEGQELNLSSSGSDGQPTEPEALAKIEKFPEWRSNEKETESPAGELSPIARAFKALKAEDRFLARLSALVQDFELLEWMKTGFLLPAAETTESETESPPEDSSAIAPVPSVDASREIESDIASATLRDRPVTADTEVDWQEREVVLDDEPWQRPVLAGSTVPRLPGTAEFAGTGDGEDSTPAEAYVLPSDEPVPTPVLDLLAAEVIAGRTIQVRVQLPDVLPRIYVKIWVGDRQTQVIVDGPRWITEFSPNGLGFMEGSAEMEVPYGCLEVRFEAIAQEMQTNRESHKVSVDRLVVPPPPPSLPLED